MTKTKVLTILTLSGMVTALACDGASSGTAGGLSTSDCALGMFRPTGLADCVFPADDLNGNPLGVSDNRCVEGQPAVPPRCASNTGGRAYLAATTTCARDYRYEPAACDRGAVIDGPDTGAAGTFFDGAAGTTTGFAAGTGGVMTGVGTGEGGSTFPGDDAAGTSGGAAGSGGATAVPIDASAADVVSID